MQTPKSIAKKPKKIAGEDFRPTLHNTGFKLKPPKEIVGTDFKPKFIQGWLKPEPPYYTREGEDNELNDINSNLNFCTEEAQNHMKKKTGEKGLTEFVEAVFLTKVEKLTELYSLSRETEKGKYRIKVIKDCITGCLTIQPLDGEHETFKFKFSNKEDIKEIANLLITASTL
jgi:hypothetical protein